MNHQISEKIVAALPVPESGNKVHFFSGSSLQGKKAPAGFGVRVTAGGTKSFVLFHRHDGKKFLETLGRWDENPQGGTLTVRDAIVRADKLAKDLKNGRREDPRPERTRRLQDGDSADGLTVGRVLDQFIERYVKKEAKLRSGKNIENELNRLVIPRVGKLGLYNLKRSQIVSLLDDIADENGPVQADRTLAYIRKAFNWWAARDDEFISPIIKGMAKTKPRDRARNRILTDDEIRAVWAVTEGQGVFGRMVRFILLTAARRTEAAEMHWSELDGADWTLPAARNKTKVDLLRPLSREALAALPPKTGAYVFSTDGRTGVSGFSQFKDQFDEAVADHLGKPLPHWTLHDLRRTARTLMSRAGVNADHAERCLGHVMPGVRGVYDRHEYLEEKREAFDALATQLKLILNPADNVAQLPRRSK